ncbi:MAG TPA: universal stress protein [Gemmatimonadales bacterium]|nr:universal stress protein [Gemmatimonadales bacterium]
MKADKILVPLDGSDVAEAAIAPALQMASSGSSLLILMRAASARTMPWTDVIDAQILAVREAEDYLDTVKKRLEQKGVGRVETHVWYGPPAPAIVEAGEKADLIVMSTHGRSGLGRLIFGSVAESVLRGTRVPILLVRPTGAPVDPPDGRDDVRPAQKSGSTTTRAEARR